MISKLYNYFEDSLYRLEHKERIYINGYVSKGNKEKKNWGDDINYWFLKEIIEPSFRLYNESPIAFRKNNINYLVIGSTISLLTKSSSIIWGAGCIDTRPLPAVPKKVLAVRGPLTQQYLNSRGIICPKIYGDPALLLPYYYKPKLEKKYKLGVIPHATEQPYEIPGSKIISMTEYKNWTDVIDEICECEFIASSSLHGIILAEAYSIPNIWIESNKILGGNFKFHDFFQSLGKDRSKPFKISLDTSITEIIKSAEYSGGAEFNLNPLIESAPFQLKL